MFHRSRFVRSPLIYGGRIIKATAAGEAFDVSFLTSGSNLNNLSTYTFSSISVGAESATRRIFVTISTAISGTLSVASVTILGVSAAAVAGATAASNSRLAAIWSAEVPTGTSGDIVINLNGSPTDCFMGAYRMVAGAAAGTDTFADSGSSEGTRNGTIDVPGNGVIIGVNTGGGSASGAWTTLSENYDLSGGNASPGSGALYLNPTGSTETGKAFSHDTSRALAAVSWAPA